VGPFRHSHLRFEALRARVLEARGRGRYRPAAAHALAALGALAAEGALPAGGEAGGEAGGPMDAALTALAADVRRVRLFTRSQFEQLWARLVDATAALRAAAEGARARDGAGAALAAPRAALDAVTDGMVALDRFVRQNAAAAGRLAQLADAPGADDGAAGGAREEYVTAAEGALLGVLRLDPLLLGLSDAFEFLSLAEGDAEAAAAAAAAAGGAPRPRWVAPREFRRVTRKFWLLPADVARFKAEVARHLPVLVYGDRRRLTEGAPAETRQTICSSLGATTKAVDARPLCRAPSSPRRS
jgi:SPX domain protein involved in polyphosphate accumulation